MLDTRRVRARECDSGDADLSRAKPELAAHPSHENWVEALCNTIAESTSQEPLGRACPRSRCSRVWWEPTFDVVDRRVETVDDDKR